MHFPRKNEFLHEDFKTYILRAEFTAEGCVTIRILFLHLNLAIFILSAQSGSSSIKTASLIAGLLAVQLQNLHISEDNHTCLVSELH